MTGPDRADGPVLSPGSAPGPAIVARGLSKRFGKVVALEGLDLEVQRGIVFGLLGPNGAGKTTTIRLLTGLARPTSGSASVAGAEVRFGDGLDARRRIGVLDQDPRFYGWMTGRELLSFAATLAGVARDALATRVDANLERVGLTDAADRRISGYSGGMRQRLGIGQALIGDPEILILDEPVSSLDPEGRRDLLALIGHLREQATVIFSTHVLSDVERVCDRVAILDHGRLVAESSLADLLGRFAPPVYVIDADPGSGLALAGLVARLQGEPWVRDVTVDGHLVRVAVSDESRAAGELLPAVVATGLPIAAYRRERPTLEDVFLQLTGAGEMAQAGAAADAGPESEGTGR